MPSLHAHLPSHHTRTHAHTQVSACSCPTDTQVQALMRIVCVCGRKVTPSIVGPHTAAQPSSPACLHTHSHRCTRTHAPVCCVGAAALSREDGMEPSCTSPKAFTPAASLPSARTGMQVHRASRQQNADKGPLQGSAKSTHPVTAAVVVLPYRSTHCLTCIAICTHPGLCES